MNEIGAGRIRFEKGSREISCSAIQGSFVHLWQRTPLAKNTSGKEHLWQNLWLCPPLAKNNRLTAETTDKKACRQGKSGRSRAGSNHQPDRVLQLEVPAVQDLICAPAPAQQASASAAALNCGYVAALWAFQLQHAVCYRTPVMLCQLMHLQNASILRAHPQNCSSLLMFSVLQYISSPVELRQLDGLKLQRKCGQLSCWLCMSRTSGQHGVQVAHGAAACAPPLTLRQVVVFIIAADIEA
eukprot:1158773-Pelagomonas_calceolata.AAC.8